ncbi:MAG: Na(+)/H(+) antiporter subunit D [Anaerovoracaceae bacterium]
MNSLHPGLILIFGGVLALILPQKLRQISLVLFPVLGILAFLTLKEGASLTYGFANGIDLQLLNVDKLSKAFVLIFLIISLVGGIYALNVKGKGEIAASLIYAGSSICVVFAKDYITLVLFWEIMAVSSLCLIWASRTKKARKAGFRYLLIHFLGGNLLMMGALIKVAGGINLIGQISGTNDLAFWLILIGVFVNGAVPPVHFWVADAYPEATISGTVFMGSFTTKVAIYAMIRLFAGSGEWVIWLGGFMAVFGAAMAIIENDIRRLLSYHIVSQLGMMVAAIGIGSELGIDGAVAHAVNNVIYKGVLLMGAGTLVFATGKRKITELGDINDLYKKMPVTAITFLIGSLAIAGLPFLNGFASKGLITAAIHEGHYVVPGMLLTLAGVGTLLSITLKINYFVFFKNGGEESLDIQIQKVPWNMNLAMIILAILCVLIGIFPGILYDILPFGTDINPFTLEHIMEYVGIFAGGIISFTMFSRIMKPHDTISLDVDWVFRKPGITFLMSTANFVELIFRQTSKAVHQGADTFKVGLNNPEQPLNAIIAKVYMGKNKPPKFKQKKDAPVGDLITSSLMVLIITFFLVYFILDVR